MAFVPQSCPPGVVRTELSKTIGNANVEAALQPMFGAPQEDELTLAPADIANTVLLAIDQPKHVAISEVIVRPARQEI
nr:hypothetical protein [Furfurilactobacillus milii]